MTAVWRRLYRREFTINACIEAHLIVPASELQASEIRSGDNRRLGRGAMDRQRADPCTDSATATTYASCERVFATSLEGRPVIMLSNNDGCVSDERGSAYS